MRIFTQENILKALEKLFISDRFILWNGNNLREVYSFCPGNLKTWFNNWDEFENYVKEHGNIFKIFTPDGHYEIPPGTWITLTPDGEKLPIGNRAKYISNELNEKMKNLRDGIENYEVEIPVRKEDTFYWPEDIYETEVVCDGNSTSLHRKLDKDGKPILKKSRYAGVDIGKGKDYSSLNIFSKKPKK